MRDAVRFLHAMGHALDLRRQRHVGVIARRAADDACLDRLTDLLATDPAPRFDFQDYGVRYQQLPLAEFDGWNWSEYLAWRGISHLAIRSLPTAATLAAFLDLAADEPAETPVWPQDRDGLSWSHDRTQLDADDHDTVYPLAGELAVMSEILTAAARGEPFRRGDACAVVASLEATRTTPDGPGLALLVPEDRTVYQAAHALNTALLALAVTDVLGMPAEERREAALAGLLHDIGMVRLPADMLGDQVYSPQDRARVRGHPLEGARLLLRQSEPFETAAVVSYEHHLRHDGSGYPRLSYPREPHVMSRIIAVCDAFDALLAPRPDRPGLESTVALLQLERSAVTLFDGRVVGAFSEAILRGGRDRGLLLTSRTF
ncbi:MAG: HD domain-containing protein [Gemmatimonadota bacterium]|mgnify:CR=1 FL=1|nr:HD domain-containing protein [Gemmatimonadota bacterium]